MVNIQLRPNIERPVLTFIALNNSSTYEVSRLMSEQEYRMRECVHRAASVVGELYRGSVYVKYLQRLRTEAAMQAASKVTPFFWADAPQIIIWLCRDCAVEVGLEERRSDAA